MTSKLKGQISISLSLGSVWFKLSGTNSPKKNFALDEFDMKFFKNNVGFIFLHSTLI